MLYRIPSLLASILLCGVSLIGTAPRVANAFMMAPRQCVSNIQNTPASNKPMSFKKAQSSKLLATSSNTNEEQRSVWTIANFFFFNDVVLVIYHSIGVAWDNLVPFGALLGALAFSFDNNLYHPYPTLLQSTGTAAWWTALIVSGLGILKLFLWDIRTFDSMASRAQELQIDYSKRVMDQSVYIGCGIAALVLCVAGGPTALGLASGVDGVLQGVMLGSCAGSVLGWCRQ
ncbi:expressed unknown protein [Seminavis robusta]|uniref:Uncharacterized protein n=1 Tax=Seminavis robusta TaxID=568900 RepID=A0A9N8EPN4_9STRA|nr:expressed unknown protein [Seminavis robusta]|eukprot:Sro1461_g274740.1 n/a (230) ;mRNA; r:5278-5967